MSPTDWQELQERRISAIEDKVEHMYQLLTKLEGAGVLIRTIFYIVAPLSALGYWIKDHIKW